MGTAHSGKRAVTMMLPTQVWIQLAEISQLSGVPRNGIASLAIEYWLQRFYNGEPLAQSLGDRGAVYDADGNKRSLATMTRAIQERIG
jgi:hypothetical protein